MAIQPKPKNSRFVSSYLQCECCRLDSRIFRGVASVTLNFIATPHLAVCFCFSTLHRHSNFQSFTLLPPAYCRTKKVANFSTRYRQVAPGTTQCPVILNHSALCCYSHVKVEFRDSSQIYTTVRFVKNFFKTSLILAYKCSKSKNCQRNDFPKLTTF